MSRRPSSDEPRVVSIDLGTQSIRASVFSLGGHCLLQRQRAVASERGQGAWEQDPSEWTGFLREELGALLRDPELAIRAIGVSGTSNGCVPIDSRGRVLANAIVHYDHRAEREALEIRRAPSYRAMSRKHALEISAGSALAKILWLARNQPEVYHRAECFLDPTAFLFHALTGVVSMDFFHAQRFFFDPVAGRFEPALFADIGVDARKLPALGNRRSFLTAPGSSQIPGLELGPDSAVTHASFDNQCALCGVGVLDRGTVHENAGSGISLRALCAEPLGAAAIACVRPPDQEAGLHVASSYIRGTGLWLREWLAANGATHQDFARQVEAGWAAAAAPGYSFHPIAETGEIFCFDAEKEEIVEDLPFDAEGCRAVFEGMAFATREVLEVLEKKLGAAQGLVWSGGFAKSTRLAPFKAALLEKAIAVSEDPEATSRGAAVIAAFGAGLFPSLRHAARAMASRRRLVHADPTSMPSPRRYRRFARQRDLVLARIAGEPVAVRRSRRT